MQATNKLDWKIYESITKYIYEILGHQSGVKVKGFGGKCKVTGRSGSNYQIDVLTTHFDGMHSYDTAIECKYWKKKVNRDIVMKVFGIIEDTNINKGVIVSKEGFTKDAIDYAKFKNIGLVTLKEWNNNDQSSTSQEIELGVLHVNLNITVTHPKLLQINLGNNRFLDVQDELDLFNYYVELIDGKRRPFYDYVADFRKHVDNQQKMDIEIIKSYKLPDSKLFRRGINESIRLDAITITGKLTQNDESKNLEFILVDKVWLIMKSIFEEKTFSFSENGLIIEHKN